MPNTICSGRGWLARPVGVARVRPGRAVGRAKLELELKLKVSSSGHRQGIVFGVRACVSSSSAAASAASRRRLGGALVALVPLVAGGGGADRPKQTNTCQPAARPNKLAAARTKQHTHTTVINSCARHRQQVGALAARQLSIITSLALRPAGAGSGFRVSGQAAGGGVWGAAPNQA